MQTNNFPITQDMRNKLELIGFEDVDSTLTYEEAFDWLRKKYSIYSIVLHTVEANWSFSVIELENYPKNKHFDVPIQVTDYTSYDEARYAALAMSILTVLSYEQFKGKVAQKISFKEIIDVLCQCEQYCINSMNNEDKLLQGIRNSIAILKKLHA
jgi:phosphoserine phosphatase